MIQHMFKSSLQSLLRNPFLSTIPFMGMVVGLTTAILTFIWVSYEFTYNRYHEENSNVFAILLNEQGDGEIITGDEVPLPYEYLIKEVPEIQSATRIDNTYLKLSIDDNSQIEKTGVFADSTFFDVHATEFISSQSENPLQDLNAIAISESAAKSLFKTNDIIGKSILINKNKEFIISALFKDYPTNSDLKHINFVIPFNAKPRDAEDIWHNIHVKLYPESNLQKAEALFNAKLKEVLGEEAPVSTLLFNMEDWRLRWNFENGKQTGGKITYVIVFMISGVLILFMSCINYMNISIAKATKKAKEIGVRKISGATQKQLAVHFMFRNILFIISATLFSLLLAYAIIPQVRELTNTPISLDFTNPLVWFGLISIVIVTSFLAGAYPAFILSSLKPVNVLKNNLFTISGGAKLRKYLLSFQLALSVFLMFGSFTVWKQIDFLLNKDVGYKRSNIINVWHGGDSQDRYQKLKNELESHSSIESVAFGGASPLENKGWIEVNKVDLPLASPLTFYMANIDTDFIKTLELKITSGRNFSRELSSDSANFIINKKAADVLGFENPIGQRVKCFSYDEELGEGEIIGVVSDFQHDDIHKPINPVILSLGKSEYLANVFVAYKPEQLNTALTKLKNTYTKLFPDKSLNYSFLDADFNNQFYAEKVLKKIAISYTCIALVIACLGILNLTLFNVQKLTKEIGIRKIHGASVFQLFKLINNDFAFPVCMALAVGLPAAYFMMVRFLINYPSRINIHPYYFVITTVSVIAIVFLVSSYYAYKSARKNPIDSLRID